MTSPLTRAATRRLVALFQKSGYVRRPDPARQPAPRTYKKGSEVRLVLATDAELAEAQLAVRALGFTPGRPFQKGNRTVLPLYGAAAVQFFLDRLGAQGRRRAGFGASGTRTTRRKPRRST